MVVKDHVISQESFTICKCNNCGLWFTNPRPDEEHIQDYYNSEAYISHEDKITGVTDALYKLVRKITVKNKVNWVNEKSSKKGKLLDFGCGTGYFLKAAQADGWQASGYEPNQKASEIARNKNNVTLYSTLDEISKTKKFDAITLFHVMEHVHNLDKTIKILLERLKKRGSLFIALPNNQSPDALAFKENWAALDVPRHLYHFNKTSMQYFADKYNLKITEIKPMVYDGYYISILSNKIVNKNNNLFKSALEGYKFNQLARKTNDYSSLLFILKKK
ncbi:class I SAM-dependent methyltransferase [Negadavirga shengliensis]|uniref:Class I SAM-dependent methyltransferase n=1 Tax=Negadavirga shengliensis TaxID=1389218 RepID=A0ABV9SWK1_9BACT